jgi:hypothetical protein
LRDDVFCLPGDSDVGTNGQGNTSWDLADAFHNLPKEMWSNGFSLEHFREDFLAGYQSKYPEQITRNYVGLLVNIFAMGNEDHSAN